MVVGTGWGVGLRPDGGEILVGRRAPGRVESHAELRQTEGRAVVDQLPGTGKVAIRSSKRRGWAMPSRRRASSAPVPVAVAEMRGSFAARRAVAG